MHELSRYLYLAGGMPFLFLGGAHALATPLRRDQLKGLSPYDPSLTNAMSATTVRLTRRTDMWLAWVGFNLSHSLGAVLFGVVSLLVGRSEPAFRTEAPFFGPLAILVSGSYLVLGIKYWFRTPIIGCAVGFGFFVLSFVFFQMAR
jgi:hypothetical protein